MQVLSVSPLRAGSVIWQPRRGVLALTVVAKATFSLLPGEAVLAEDQEFPNEEPNHWNDDPARSVYAPSNIVPGKARADVMLVGHAFAPGGEPVQSLRARLDVGALGKEIEVFGERGLAPGGRVVEGPPFSKMQLRYERAAGGDDTDNPVGMRTGPRARADETGLVPLPNLMPPVTMPGPPMPPSRPSASARSPRAGPSAGGSSAPTRPSPSTAAGGGRRCRRASTSASSTSRRATSSWTQSPTPSASRSRTCTPSTRGSSRGCLASAPA